MPSKVLSVLLLATTFILVGGKMVKEIRKIRKVRRIGESGKGGERRSGKWGSGKVKIGSPIRCKGIMQFAIDKGEDRKITKRKVLVRPKGERKWIPLPVSVYYSGEMEKRLTLTITVVDSEIDTDNDQKEIYVPLELHISLENNRGHRIIEDIFYYEDINYKDRILEVNDKDPYLIRFFKKF